MKLPVYLDNHATTPLDPRVVEAMLPYFSDRFGNAASRQHEFGWVAEAGVNVARQRIADLIGAEPSELTFTSGATESINLALKGIAEGLRGRGNHFITAVTEHRAVLDTCRRLEGYGFQVTYLPVDSAGRISLAELEDAITPKTILVSIMAANNEIGTLAPIAEIGRLCSDRGILLHSDATQAVGRIPLDLRNIPVDLVSFTAHKMYGPKGIGVLYIRSRRPPTPVVPQIDGGGHERGLRSGTLNVPAIVGFGEAARISATEMEAEARQVSALRDALVEGLRSRIPGIRVNGDQGNRLPNNASVTFEGTRADRVMMDMKDIAVSSGSACSTGLQEPSHVLRALGLPDQDVRATLRFGLGRFTTAEEITYAVGRIAETIKKERKRMEVEDAVHVH